MDSLQEWHRKNDYYIDISKIEGGCLIRYPANLLAEPKLPEQKIKYICGEDEISYQIDYNNIETLATVNYAVRPLVVADFMLKSFHRNILDVKLVYIHDGDKKEDKIRYILPQVKSEEIFLKEKVLLKNITSIMMEQFTEESAMLADVLEGYTSIVNLVNRGGL